MVDGSKVTVTPEQEYIMATHSRMVGKVLDLIEASMAEGNQLEKLAEVDKVPSIDDVHLYSDIVPSGSLPLPENDTELYNSAICGDIEFSVAVGGYDVKTII